MESIFTGLPIFSWQKRATNGSSFCALEKKARRKNLGVESGK